jgi:hypothetical protein
MPVAVKQSPPEKEGKGDLSIDDHTDHIYDNSWNFLNRQGAHELQQNLVAQRSGLAGCNGSDCRQSPHRAFVFADAATHAAFQIDRHLPRSM